MTGCHSEAPIYTFLYSYGPYWIVLFSSLWRESPPLLLIDTVQKVWNRSWQQLLESQDQQQRVSVLSHWETTVFRTLKFLCDYIDLVLLDVNPSSKYYKPLCDKNKDITWIKLKDVNPVDE